MSNRYLAENHLPTRDLFKKHLYERHLVKNCLSGRHLAEKTFVYKTLNTWSNSLVKKHLSKQIVGWKPFVHKTLTQKTFIRETFSHKLFVWQALGWKPAAQKTLGLKQFVWDCLSGRLSADTALTNSSGQQVSLFKTVLTKMFVRQMFFDQKTGNQFWKTIKQTFDYRRNLQIFLFLSD